MKQSLGRLWKENTGGSVVEYALLGAVMMMGAVAALGTLTHSVKSSLSRAAAGVTAGSSTSMVAGGGLTTLPSSHELAPPAPRGSSRAATMLARLAGSVEANGAIDSSFDRLFRLEATAVKTASEAGRYAKSWLPLSHNGAITGAQSAIVAGWTSAVPH